MNTYIHICANKRWGGAETRASVAASKAARQSVVICEDSEAIIARIRGVGLSVFGCKISGVFAPISLSRVLRHVGGEGCSITVHSPEIISVVKSAIGLSGRKDLHFVEGYEIPDFPAVDIKKTHGGVDKDGKVLLWIGRITPDCGLLALIDAIGRCVERKGWRLKVVGEGDAKVAMPLVNRTRALGVDKRVEWVGYVANVYEHMSGADFGIVTRENPENRTVTREFAAAGIPVICGTETETLYNRLTELL